MAVGCKCLTFDIDNTGNPEMTLYVQAGDVQQNVGGVYNHYTDNTWVIITAGYVGPVTVNFAGKFINGGSTKLDSTQIKSFDFQPIGKQLSSSPWNYKFKGTFSIDNVVLPPSPEINVEQGTTTVLTTTSTSIPNVASGSNGTAQTFTVQNLGTASLALSSITISGANASEFVLGSLPALPGSIAASSTATFTVTFKPTSVATGKTATVTIASNDANEANYTIVINADGTTPVTGINAAQANISSSKLYPNPVSDMANVELDLISSSDVKVTLSDLMGREVMVVASGNNISSLSQSFSVSSLNKGIYTVNYFINGSAAKSQLLMVK